VKMAIEICHECGTHSASVKFCAETIVDWMKHDLPNAGGEGREPCERTSPPPCSVSPAAQPPRDVSELYHELLYAVARKFHGESRHETALRYIRDTEERVGQTGSCKQNAKVDAPSGATAERR